MKYIKIIKALFIFIAMLLSIWACSKSLRDVLPLSDLQKTDSTKTTIGSIKDSTNKTTDTSKNTNPIVPPVVNKPNVDPKSPCNLIAYADTLVFLKNQKDDYKIRPIQSYEGEYGSLPEGLEIDHNNGEINITKSETGLRYKVFFIAKKSRDTCFTFLTVSGIDYRSFIYVLDKNDSLAIPIYNSNGRNIIPGSSNSGSGNSGGGNSGSGKDGTEFDDGPDDDNGDGIADEPLPGQEVIPQGLEISKSNGKIRLDKSVNNGFFGSNPASGSSKKVKIYYRIDDASGKSLNKIEVQFHFYKSLNEVPNDLKNQVIENQQYYDNNGVIIKNGRVLRLPRKPRPPDIVIVARS